MLGTQVVTISSLRSCTENIGSGFWQLWEQYRDDLYRCCLKWMGGNLTNAEDALSRAMLKAWEKVQKYPGEIANFKAWLTTLTHNLCIDIHRECDRRAKRVENIEVYASVDDQRLITFDDTPEIAMETGEKRIMIRGAIANLPTRLRETFILHFYQELSYQEIAQQQNISYQNVCKRISQARAILREELREYFIGEDRTDKDLSVTPNLAAIGEMSHGKTAVEPIVVGEEPQEIVHLHFRLVLVAAISDRRLEVKRDSHRCVEAMLCKFLPAPILALAQFDKETESCGNSCLVIERIEENSEMGKESGEFLLPSRSPPTANQCYVQLFVNNLFWKS